MANHVVCIQISADWFGIVLLRAAVAEGWLVNESHLEVAEIHDDDNIHPSEGIPGMVDLPV